MGTAPDTVKRLVDRFNQQADIIRSADYNETLIRIDFINPLMKALGWDIDNSAGYAEQYREVVHEDRVKVAGQTKAPDYSFRVGGQRKFFLEAKKPAVDIKNHWEPAYQLRRYAWSAKLAVSLLTDFEEFAIYDTRIQPKQLEKASTGRREFLNYTDYLQRWDFLEGTFSKDAVLRGAFDRYCESKKGRGAAPVDDVFLGEIEEWRKALALSLARRNEALDEAALNFAVQRIIDRILFLRIAEDRGTETVGQLQSLLNGESVYPRLVTLFRRADERYNSGLFHFAKEKERDETPDTLTPALEVDDKTLKAIIGGLYYPKSPYEFTMVPAEILGSVYERFLGKVITLTSGHSARIEEKPEVRKAGGVYYTPAYIVDYIVQNTVGKLLEGKTPKEAARLKILDPACGSGSFLIGAYQFLLEWYLRQYTADPASAAGLAQQKNAPIRPAIVKSAESPLEGEIIPGWALTIAERKRILLAHLHGVDLDAQAVEVTKLNLLLKCLEGETSQTLGFEGRLFRERALPDLGKNILCGNSLIGTDIIGTEAWEKMSEEERARVNPFDYERAFPQVFKGKDGGFDAVIGNPPYLNIDDSWGKSDARLGLIKTSFPHIYTDKTDLLFYFLARSVTLSRQKMGMIVSRAFLEAYKAAKLRTFLASNLRVEEIIDFRNYYVFDGVGITTLILLGDRKPTDTPSRGFALVGTPATANPLIELETDCVFRRSSFVIPRGSADNWSLVDGAQSALNAKIDQAGVPLKDVLILGQGMQTGLNDVFGARTLEELRGWGLEPGSYFRRAANSIVHRYHFEPTDEYLIFPEVFDRFEDMPPGLQAYLQANSKELRERAAYQRGNCEWWRYTWPLHKERYGGRRLICPYLASRNRFALDAENEYLGLTDTTVLFENGQPESLLYLLGILNSKLLTYRFSSIGKLKSGGIVEYFWNSLGKLSIRRINFSLPDDRQRHDRLVSLVDTMLALHKRLATEQLPQRREQIERQIEATDRQIDALVYQLYGLSDEEIALVEEATA